MAARISKSRFQKGLQCRKALWLAVHRHDLATPPDEAQAWLFEQGAEVGRLAHRLFPGGVEVTEDHLHSAEALATTERLLAEGARVLYEPAFTFDGAFARIDVLAASGDGRWDLYEVKSSASLKEQHVTDAAVQAYAVEGSGLALRTINVVHLDTSYVYPGGEYDPRALFVVEDVTQAARAFLPTVPGLLAEFGAMLEGPEPEVRIGSHCTNPYACDFIAYCSAGLPERCAVTDLAGLSASALDALLEAGITSIADIPEGFPFLSARQRLVVDAVKRQQPVVDASGLARGLSGLAWPVRHLDFETVAPALPLWPGTRPYQTVPFQYSVHVQHADGTLEHRSYLHRGADDPRRPLAERLLADLGEHGTITHYTPYEVRVIDGLVAEFPDLAGRLTQVKARLFDLASLVKQYTTHPDTCGRWSIKHVLPAWCPDLSYDDLGIASGSVASIRYLRLLRGELTGADAQAAYEQLEEYCALDTLAMVRLLEELRKLAGLSAS